jgi:uncharacterized protein (DUF1330 family)
MNTLCRSFLGLIVTAAFVVATIGKSDAQTKPPEAYVIVEISVGDPAAEAKLVPLLLPTIEAYGGRFLVRGGKTAPFEGEPPKRIVVIAFESMEKAQAWYDLPRRKEIDEMRHKAGTRLRTYAVEALPR